MIFLQLAAIPGVLESIGNTDITSEHGTLLLCGVMLMAYAQNKINFQVV